MPFVRITIADPDLSASAGETLVTSITSLLVSDLGKEPDVIVVHINLVPADRWFVARERPVGATGAHVEVSITDGTNSRQEKEAFLRHTYELLGETLGTLPSTVYVALYELNAESYGYNGVSQLARKEQNADEKD
jgi:4-oxalocrotonate tautomerase